MDPGPLQKYDSNDVPVLRAALLVARHAYPDLDESAVTQQLDQWAAEVEAGLPETRYPMRVLQEINKVLYKHHAFQGNDKDYYNRDNSCLNKVIETRTGKARRRKLSDHYRLPPIKSLHSQDKELVQHEIHV
jgi:regulator of sirC expression with transglutaminase-like and TPR domain